MSQRSGGPEAEPRAAPLLRFDEVTLRFFGVTALREVSFSVAPGELLAVIGPNGAGKTTIFNCINGVYRPQSGRIELHGRPLPRGPVEVARLRIARTFQNLGLFENLSVLDNLMLGRHMLMRTGFLSGALWLGRARREEVEHRVRVEEVVELLELEQHRHRHVAVLPFGIKKRVELGRALAMEPELLLLDEPVAGMNLEEAEDMARYLLEVRRRLGTAMILVEHDMGFVMDLADRIVVLDFGQVIAEGDPEQVQRDDRVIEAYLGERSVSSLPGVLIERAAERPDAVALRHKQLGRWREWSWAEYGDRVARAGLALLELGVESGDRVAIQSENRPAWLLADLGAQGIGAVSVGVYPTSPAAEVEYVLHHSGARVLFCEDEEQLDKALEVRERLPALERIVITDPRGVAGLDDDPMLITFEDFERLGAGRSREEYDGRVAGIDPAEVAIIVYTSGTTGPPKGAMLTHANLVAAADSYTDVFELSAADEVLSYLPLCHIAERLLSVVDAVRAGYVVNFGEGAETFAADLAEVQPTFFLGVPRVWERMMATVEIRVADADPLKLFAYRFWIARGRALARRRFAGRRGIGHRLAGAIGWLFLYRALREKLGMRRVRVALSGAAPIAPEVLEWLWAFGVPVREGYGQTENTAMATYTPADEIRIGRVGRALPGVELRIADDGEILTRSAGVFAGYWQDPQASADAVDSDGWLHTGDIGEIDADGFLAITDRKKDIIITAGGKNVSPSEIENKLKVSPFVREAVVIGDRRKYLTALIGIEGDVVGDWASRRGIPYTTYADLAARPEVRELVAGAVETANSELARVEGIKRFELLTVELDHEDGQLTATQKVRRAAIAREFERQIEEMYR